MTFGDGRSDATIGMWTGSATRSKCSRSWGTSSRHVEHQQRVRTIFMVIRLLDQPSCDSSADLP